MVVATANGAEILCSHACSNRLAGVLPELSWCRSTGRPIGAVKSLKLAFGWLGVKEWKRTFKLL